MVDLSPGRLICGIVLALLAAGGAYIGRLLTVSGAIAAAIIGAIVFGLGGWPFAAPLLVFFLTSSVLSRLRKRAKDNLGFEKTGRRDAAQVFANGGIAVLCLLAPLANADISQAIAHVAFLAAIAGANADTWATEIGAAWGGEPFMVTSWRRVERGASGGVTAIGFTGALVGAGLIGFFGGTLREFAVVTAAGLLGSLIDSVLGATLQAHWRDDGGRLTEQRGAGRPDRGVRWIRNDAVNLICTLSSAVLATILCAILPIVS